MAIFKKTNDNCWRHVGEKEHVVTLDGDVTVYVSEEPSQKAKYRTSVWANYTTQGYLPKGFYTLLQKYLLIHTLLFYLKQIEASSKIFFTIFHEATW